MHESRWIVGVVIIGIAVLSIVVLEKQVGAVAESPQINRIFTTATPAPAVEVAYMVPEVIAVRPHDPEAFTQGLLFHEGLLYESAGLYGESTLRQVDSETGEVLQSVEVPEDYFAEGLALADGRLIQLTWKETTALVYDLETFEAVDSYKYEGEGWGLCYDGERFVMSDGSADLFFRDPEIFELLDQITVTFDEQPVNMLNELECVDGDIYANIWQTDFIIRIDPATGYIDTVINAEGLLTDEEYAALQPGSVLNGIAYDPENETFLITGKRWPKLFEVQFVPYEE